jgi:YlmC/YmxH family sporulation protein
MRHKEVISIKDGTRLGCVNDVEVDTTCGKVVAIVIYGRLRCFGLLGREDDIVIKWEDIQVIGDDTILVCHTLCMRNKKHGRGFGGFFGPG